MVYGFYIPCRDFKKYFLYWNHYRFIGSCKSTERPQVPPTQFPPMGTFYITIVHHPHQEVGIDTCVYLLSFHHATIMTNQGSWSHHHHKDSFRALPLFSYLTSFLPPSITPSNHSSVIHLHNFVILSMLHTENHTVCAFRDCPSQLVHVPTAHSPWLPCDGRTTACLTTHFYRTSGSLQFGAITNKAAMNILTWLFVWTKVFISLT